MKYQVESYLPDFGEQAKSANSYNELEIEDGGHAVIFSVDDGKDSGMFVQLRSWSNGIERILDSKNETDKLRKAHPQFNRFAGRKVRITIETLDETK